MIHEDFYCDLYRENVTLVGNCSPEEFEAKMKKWKIPEDGWEAPDNVHGQYFNAGKDDDFRHYIYIKDGRKIEHIIHECVHLCMNIFELKNIHVGYTGSQHEHFAYYLQLWVQRFHGALNKRDNQVLKENKELNRILDMQRTRMDKATKYWQKKTGEKNVLPDLGDLLDFLMESHE